MSSEDPIDHIIMDYRLHHHHIGKGKELDLGMPFRKIGHLEEHILLHCMENGCLFSKIFLFFHIVQTIPIFPFKKNSIFDNYKKLNLVIL